MRRLHRRRGGFTLIEAMISLAILGIMGVAFTSSMRSMANLTHAGKARSNVQREGASALETIMEDLRWSGFVTAGGLDYPYLFANGEPDADFDRHKHAVPPGEAQSGDYDYCDGLVREIVLVLPQDDDQDRIPDLDPGTGVLLWSADEISYVLGVDARGDTVLERRVNAKKPDAIAHGVERVIFDDAESSGFEIPNDAVRVRIYFRVKDEVGREVRYSVEGMARLRNGVVDDD
jgi:prepilin-type N-terminal cleavage/methylation domain-containing protein